MNLKINTAKPYQILIERGCLRRAGEEAARVFPGGAKTVIVTDSNVGPIYAHAVASSLEAAGFQSSVFPFPAGEEHKRTTNILGMYAAFSDRGLTRSDFVVALGGGVTGDMAGFAAATYLRGIRFLQIPTSLLAQIDSSVGGKTGVDLPQGKNLVGAFHQPSLVLIDPDTLSTLPDAFFADGLGEAIKYGCIRDGELFGRIAAGGVKDEIEPIIYRCVDIKREFVERDELDNGDRMLLNFGHTFGHALEKLHAYKDLTHGEAVGIGMVMMSRCGEAAGLTEPGTAEKIARVLSEYGMPVSDPADPDLIREATQVDKKSRGDNINLVLLRHIGESFLHPIPRAELGRFMEALS
ncbi:3-dehydroquinate synthase [Caprobacter fermentans]|uniref:3-dehydroquinate synthase n=1 Tax=Caproicibacter fermentans TaxID=2576756 RepID=A0A6N8I4X1_9FIRM|nr:3-dehydroquinate synthase [Caproicibacter fermentans]MVB12650.1 3-dehydroquinate synthase [Caproicibacter fermentans]QNK39208.1 3-dehydroquinate synthase [Caproicibacter fermentans]